MEKKEKTQQEIYQESFIREVDDDLRAERLEKMWVKYRKFIFGGVALILLSTVAYQLYLNARLKVRLSESDKYEQAAVLNAKGESEGALALYRELQDGRTNYKYLAQMRTAGILFEQEKDKEALALLNALRQNSDAPEALRSVAAIGYVSHLVDAGDVKELQGILNPMMTPDNAWYGTAAELSVLLLLRENEVAKAKRLLEESLKKQDLSPIVKTRLQVWQNILEM